LQNKGIFERIFNNIVIYSTTISILSVIIVYKYFNLNITLFYIISSIVSILFLEAVNYIEHYGIKRKKIGDEYEKIQLHHSWDSDTMITNFLIWNIQRHSDHHLNSLKDYQILSPNTNNVNMLPTGNLFYKIYRLWRYGFVVFFS
jgi:alkane 1-monooxygenase